MNDNVGESIRPVKKSKGETGKRVSVALATYNGEKFVKEQIESILAQTVPVHEIIVVDDGSTDKTIEILKAFKNKKLQIHRNNQNLGITKNFEKAISLCSGDYVALSDQDDIWHPSKIEMLLTEIQDNALIYTDGEFIDSSGALLGKKLSQVHAMIGATSESPDILEGLALTNFVRGCTMMISKKMQKAIIPIPENPRLHDWWICVKALSTGKIKYVPQSAILYRLHGKNFSKKKAASSLAERRAAYAHELVFCIGLMEQELGPDYANGRMTQMVKYAEDFQGGKHKLAGYIQTLKYSKYLFPELSVPHRYLVTTTKFLGLW